MDNRCICDRIDEITSLKIDVGVLQSEVNGVKKDISLIRDEVKEVKVSMEKVADKIDKQFRWILGTLITTGVTLFVAFFSS